MRVVEEAEAAAAAAAAAAATPSTTTAAVAAAAALTPNEVEDCTGANGNRLKHHEESDVLNQTHVFRSSGSSSSSSSSSSSRHPVLKTFADLAELVLEQARTDIEQFHGSPQDSCGSKATDMQAFTVHNNMEQVVLDLLHEVIYRH